ncbi:MAG: hypothetical protein K8H99_07345 [Nitrospirae bacterium]|nr:hypothetical protein [Fimbriimonadaceae bacterium]
MGGTHSREEFERERSQLGSGTTGSERFGAGLATTSPLAAAMPHRAYRRVEPENKIVMALTVLVIGVIHYYIFINFHPIMLAMSEWSKLVLSWLNIGAVGQSYGYDNYMWVRLYPLVYDIHEPDTLGYLIWTIGGIVLIVLFALLRVIAAPVRLTILTILLLLTFGSVYMLIVSLANGSLGFDGFEISKLYVRAVLLTWAFMPIGFAILSLLIPFNPIERIVLVFLPIIYDFPFSVVRYAVMVWITNWLGGVPAAPFFLLFGSAITFLFYVCLFSLMMNRVAKRVGGGPNREARWRW